MYANLIIAFLLGFVLAKSWIAVILFIIGAAFIMFNDKAKNTIMGAAGLSENQGLAAKSEEVLNAISENQTSALNAVVENQMPEGLINREEARKIMGELEPRATYLENYAPNPQYIGDDRLTDKMAQIQKKGRKQHDIRSNMTKYSVQHFFDQELKLEENRRWWDNADYEKMF